MHSWVVRYADITFTRRLDTIIDLLLHGNIILLVKLRHYVNVICKYNIIVHKLN